MTAKRFTTKNIICSNYCVWDNNDNPYGNDEVVELLNELAEENKAFNEDELYITLTERGNKLIAENNRLHEENQRLKKQLESEHTMLDNAILLERTRMGKNCLKQFRDAIQ